MILENRSQVCVSQMKVASCLGEGIDALWQALRKSESGLSFEHSYKQYTLAPLGEFKPRLSLTNLASQMTEQLVTEAHLTKRYASERIGLFLGTTTAGVETALVPLAAFYQKQDARVEDFLKHEHVHGTLAHAVAQHCDLKGPAFVYACACSSGAVALARAAAAVATGLVDVAIAGGLDVLTQTTVSGFASLQVLDEQLCRPFSKERNGINLAEGGALFVLERLENASTPLALLQGWGFSTDAHHLTQPEPQGVGMALCMQRALLAAGLQPVDVDYVNAHGTGTAANDEAEARALHTVFGGDEFSSPLVSSTKGIHGHTLGGAGALEAAVCVQALVNEELPGGVGAGESLLASRMLHSTQPKKNLRCVLSNSFGFGGHNTSLVFAKVSQL